MTTASIAEWQAAGVLSEADAELSATLSELPAGPISAEVTLAAAFAAWAVRNGHTCAALPALVEKAWYDEEGQRIQLGFPELSEWLSELERSPLVARAEQTPMPIAPLILTAEGRLYLARYYRYEQRLAESLIARASGLPQVFDGELLRQGLSRFFPGDNPKLEDQRTAALLGLLRNFALVSGGPGTGKTFTTAKVLLLLQEQALRAKRAPFQILLLAPTGKAAQRLGEAIRKNLEQLDCSDALREAIPKEAATIHRALGFQPRSPTQFRHHRSNPLPYDVVLVDEASMVDVALMAKLVDAVPENARLLLLGDKDQLASVEAGAVLGDIYGSREHDGYSRAFVEHAKQVSQFSLPASPSRVEPGLQDCLVHLRHSHRFAEGGSIAAVASQIKTGKHDWIELALAGKLAGVELRPPVTRSNFDSALGSLILQHFGELAELEAEAQLKRLDGFRILCCHRRGPGSVDELNLATARYLQRRGRLESLNDYYAGRPIAITTNDYQLELFNGDVGVVSSSGRSRSSQSGLLAYFPGKEPGSLRRFPVGRLPPHETVFAMSVHKSQGSEFDEIALILPDYVSPIVTRELVYTAVTRARRKVVIYGLTDILRKALDTRVERASGLPQVLWGSAE